MFPVWRTRQKSYGGFDEVSPEFFQGKILAEREGFEPSRDTRPLLVFETSPFNRSGTSPKTLVAYGAAKGG